MIAIENNTVNKIKSSICKAIEDQVNNINEATIRGRGGGVFWVEATFNIEGGIGPRNRKENHIHIQMVFNTKKVLDEDWYIYGEVGE